MKSIMEMIREAPSIEYDPTKGITMKEVGELLEAAGDYKQRKPEYLLSRWEAENLPLWQLTWLGENYIVLASLEIAEIVQKREANEK